MQHSLLSSTAYITTASTLALHTVAQMQQTHVYTGTSAPTCTCSITVTAGSTVHLRTTWPQSVLQLRCNDLQPRELHAVREKETQDDCRACCSVSSTVTSTTKSSPTCSHFHMCVHKHTHIYMSMHPHVHPLTRRSFIEVPLPLTRSVSTLSS